MQTRIRYLRKMRGWTLQKLADQVGTTAQTIQRLETSNMTVSLDWLQKVADAFNVSLVELISDNGVRDIPFLGVISTNACFTQTQEQTEHSALNFDVPAADPVAVRIGDNIGAYKSGTILIADRLTGSDMTNVLGQDVLAALASDLIMLCRLIKGKDDSYTLVPILSGELIRYDQQLKWVGRIVMQVTYT